ncbi:hypothetical protein SAY87_018310 [Trapa incisa]|uniref:Phosphatidic acid phosphatase type 2/haloperoxidase domain-containing protein n=1 Tax=Trapa incisa TaxID=236973 RepID=A0AAN7KXC8_9MYRT|nr:hypothetical protein SAY87_018310 [Trapa incisa]
MEVPLTAPTLRPIYRLRCCATSFPNLGSSKSKPTRFPCLISARLSGFDPFTGRRRASVQSKMDKAAAFSSDSSDVVGRDEGIRAFEQEAFISNSNSSNSNSSNYFVFMADGIEGILNRMSKWIIFALFGTIILWRHDAESLWAVMGSVTNVTLSVVLKRILNQERPISTLRSDPGMPSSHGQSIFFMVVYAILSIFEWLGVNGLSLTLGLLMFATGTYFSWLRVSQQLHTISQVVVGAVLGSTFAGLWYWSWKAFVLEAFNSLLWVRITIILGAVGLCIGFLLHVIRHWFKDER